MFALKPREEVAVRMLLIAVILLGSFHTVVNVEASSATTITSPTSSFADALTETPATEGTPPVAGTSTVTPMPSPTATLPAPSEETATDSPTDIIVTTATPVPAEAMLGAQTDPSSALLTLNVRPNFITTNGKADVQWEITAMPTEEQELMLEFTFPIGIVPEVQQGDAYDEKANTLIVPVYNNTGHIGISAQNLFDDAIIIAILMNGKNKLAEASLLLHTKEQFGLTPAGGEIQTEDGKIKLRIPANTFSDEAVIEIGGPGADEIPAYSLSGHPFSIKAHDKDSHADLHQFDTEIEIEATYEYLDVPEGKEGSIFLYWYNPEIKTWEALPSLVDKETKTVTGVTNHFSLYEVGLNNWQAARMPTVADFQVSTFTGAGTFSLPIEVPPGPGGLQPDLTLSYNSQTVDQANLLTQASWVGMGWSLETGSIERVGDTYFLNVAGASTRLINQNGTFHAANENFWRFEFSSSNNTWTVWDKTGNVYFFMDTATMIYDQQCASQPGRSTYKWMLSSVRYRYGNYLQYQYAREAKNVQVHVSGCALANYSSDTAIYLDAILYPNSRYRIYFEREDRSDYHEAWVTDAAHHNFERKRLKNIYIQQDADGLGFVNPTQNTSQTIRRYEFTYESDPAKVIFPGYRYNPQQTGLTSTLKSVREFGRYGTTGLPAHTFSYDGLHLTKAENGYGGRVEYDYEDEPWYADSTTSDYTLTYDFGQNCTTQGWSALAGSTVNTKCNVTDPFLYVRGGAITGELRTTSGLPMIRPGGVYRYTSQIGLYDGMSLQFGSSSNGTNYNLTGNYQVSGPVSHIIHQPVNALTMQAVIQTSGGTSNSYAHFYDFKIELLPSFYRVLQKRIYASLDANAIPYSYSYAYLTPAVNDSAHSSLVCAPGASTCKSLETASSEFRGHQFVTETSPDGSKTTTEYYQDDILKGIAKEVTGKTPNDSLLKKTVYNYSPVFLGNYTPPGYTLGYNLYWIRASSTENYVSAGATWTGAATRVSYDGYDAYGNVISQSDQYQVQPKSGEEWLTYRTTTTNYNPKVSATHYLVSLPSQQNFFKGAGELTAQTVYWYDDQTSASNAPIEGKLTAVLQWASGANYIATSYGYDAWGNRTSVSTYSGYGAPTQAAGARTTTTTYDPIYHTYPISIVNPLNQTTSFTYDYYMGMLTRETDPNGAQTRAEYDSFGRITRVYRPDPVTGQPVSTPTLTMQYEDTIPFTTTITQHVNGSEYYSITRLYDGMGRQTQSISYPGAAMPPVVITNGIRVDTIYESATVTKQTVPYQGAFAPDQYTTTQSNPNARTVTVMSPDGTSVVTYTDGLTSTVTQKNASGGTQSITTTTTDVWGRTVSVTPKDAGGQPIGPNVTYTYDSFDRLLTATRGGKTTAMKYDNAGRKIGMDDPDMGTSGTVTDTNWAWRYQYDALGNLTSQTDARGCVLTLTYDLLNRLDTKTSSGSGCGQQININYDYDAGLSGKGRRTSMTDASGSTSWAFDARGRMISETKTITGISYITRWGYNSADLVTSLTYPDGEAITNTYNAQMQLNGVIGTNNYVQSTTYDAAGRIDLRTYGNTIQTDYGYYPWNTANQGGRLQFIKSGTTLAPISLQSLEYAYDPAGNVDWIKDWKTASPQTQDFTYDALNRLTNAVTSGGTVGTYNESYGYNTATGNLTSKAGVTLAYADANHAHAVSSAGGNSYLYDANGNMTRRTPSTGSAYNFAYDAEGHLVEVKLGTTIIASFKYDGDGKRVQSVINGVTTLYYGLVEIDNHGAVQTLPPVFSDVPNEYWAKSQIEGLYNLGILSACATNPLRYCPASNVTRIDAIRDILRAKYGSGYVPPAPSHYFADMAGHPLEAWADQAYRDGITSGCSSNPRNFCPASNVTRAEIVIFLLKAKYGGSHAPPAASHYFADMNGHWAEAWADQAYREGITTGCSSSPRNFCPSGTIARDMNAVFIENTFHLIPPPPAFAYNGAWRKYYFAGASRIAVRTCAGSGSTACSAPTFFLSDHLGSTSASVSMNGEKTSEILYKPWGEVRSASSATASLPTPYTFTGQFSYMDDPTTTGTTEGFGLLFYQARWYDPLTGRFAQADTIIPPSQGVQAWDRYAYANNNPLRYTDPTGHMMTEGCGDDGKAACRGSDLEKATNAQKLAKLKRKADEKECRNGGYAHCSGYQGFQIQLTIAAGIPTELTNSNGDNLDPFIFYGVSLVFDKYGGFQLYGLTRDISFDPYFTTGPADDANRDGGFIGAGITLAGGIIGGSEFAAKGTDAYGRQAVDSTLGVGIISVDHYEYFDETAGTTDGTKMNGDDIGLSIGTDFSAGNFAVFAHRITPRVGPPIHDPWAE